jgi:hypothetical protein
MCVSSVEAGSMTLQLFDLGQRGVGPALHVTVDCPHVPDVPSYRLNACGQVRDLRLELVDPLFQFAEFAPVFGGLAYRRQVRITVC